MSSSHQMSYHIIKMHSDNNYMIYHEDTQSDCPINAVNILMSQIWEECGGIHQLVNIPFVKEYFKSIPTKDGGEDSGVYYENLYEEHAAAVIKMVIDYCETAEKALEVIKMLEDCKGFDPIFVVLTTKNSEYIKFINRANRDYIDYESGSEDEASEDEPSDD